MTRTVHIAWSLYSQLRQDTLAPGSSCSPATTISTSWGTPIVRSAVPSSAPVVGTAGWRGPVVHTSISLGCPLVDSRLLEACVHLLLTFELLWVTPKERIHHDIPLLGTRHHTAEVQDLTRQKPVEKGDGLLTLVVRWDGDVNVFQRRVGVAKRDD